MTGPPANEVGGAANATRHVASAFPATPPRLGPGPGEKCGGGGMNGRKARDGWVGLGVGVLQGGSLGVDLATAADLEGMTRAPAAAAV